MKKIKLGHTDLETAPIIFGGNVFGWTIDEPQSFKILDQFVADGFNMIDTANSYSHWKPGNKGGESETIIGNWLKRRGQRQDIIIATKVGSDMGKGRNLKANYIKTEVEGSLRRLNTDYIDLYFSHYDDTSISVEEPLRVYEDLIKEGKVRWIGASNFGYERLKEALVVGNEKNLPIYQVYQPGYNLYDREDFEKEHEKITLEHEMGVIPYYSLASGFLTGKYKSTDDLAKSARGEGVKKYLTERGDRILQALEQVSQKHHVEMSAVALAWLIMHPSVSAPIASATKLEQLKSFVQASQLLLDADDISVLDRASIY